MDNVQLTSHYGCRPGWVFPFIPLTIERKWITSGVHWPTEGNTSFHREQDHFIIFSSLPSLRVFLLGFGSRLIKLQRKQNTLHHVLDYIFSGARRICLGVWNRSSGLSSSQWSLWLRSWGTRWCCGSSWRTAPCGASPTTSFSTSPSPTSSWPPSTVCQGGKSLFLISMKMLQSSFNISRIICSFLFMRDRVWLFGAYCRVNNFIAYLTVSARFKLWEGKVSHIHCQYLLDVIASLATPRSCRPDIYLGLLTRRATKILVCQKLFQCHLSWIPCIVYSQTLYSANELLSSFWKLFSMISYLFHYSVFTLLAITVDRRKVQMIIGYDDYLENNHKTRSLGASSLGSGDFSLEAL